MKMNWCMDGRWGTIYMDNKWMGLKEYRSDLQRREDRWYGWVQRIGQMGGWEYMQGEMND